MTNLEVSVIHRVFLRIEQIAMERYREENGQDDARAIWRTLGSLRYELFGAVEYDDNNPLRRPVCKDCSHDAEDHTSNGLRCTHFSITGYQRDTVCGCLGFVDSYKSREVSA